MLAKSDFTRQEVILIALCSASIGFSYSLVSVSVPVIPQYFRDSGIYHNISILVNTTNNDGTLTTTYKTVYPGENAANGLLFSCYEFAQLLAQPFYAFILKSTFTPSNLILVVMPGLVLTSTSFALCSTYSGLFISRLLQGIVGGGVNCCGFARIGETFTGQRRVTAMQLVCIGYQTALKITPFVAGVLYDHYGKTVPFMVVAFMALIITIAWYIHYFGNQSYEPTSETTPLITESLKSERKDIQITFRHLITHFTPFVLIFVTFIERTTYLFIPPLLSNRLHQLQPGISQGMVGLILPGGLLGSIIAMWLAGIAPRFKWYTLPRGLYITQIGFMVAMIIFAEARNYAMMFISSMLLEGSELVSTSIKFAAMCDYVNNDFGSENTTKAFACLLIFDNIGAVLSQTVGGAVVDATSFSTGCFILAGIHGVLLTTLLPRWLRYEHTKSNSLFT